MTDSTAWQRSGRDRVRRRSVLCEVGQQTRETFVVTLLKVARGKKKTGSVDELHTKPGIARLPLHLLCAMLPPDAFNGNT